MKKFWILLLLLVLLVACNLLSSSPVSTPPGTQDPESTPILTSPPDLSGTVVLADAQGVVDDLKALCCQDGWWPYLSSLEDETYEKEKAGEEFDAGVIFLESLEAAGERFDASEIFTALTHLEPEDGYLLDYVYRAPRDFGAPYLYARQESGPPLANYEALKAIGYEEYLDHIQVDGTAEGYFELAVLSIMGHQFYLSGIATYDDWEVVGSQERLEEIIDEIKEDDPYLTEEQEGAILALDTSPEVKIKRNKVQVQLLVFTKWGGFFQRTYTIDRDFPHRMKEKEIELVPYNCGVVI